MKVGAGKYVSGWPDMYAYHPVFKQRWVEMKAPGEKLRASQIKRFTKMDKYGCDIWVLEDRSDYARLFREPNWREYQRL